MFTLDDARERKPRLQAALSQGKVKTLGLGISKENDEYLLVVNLEKPVDEKLLPASVDGMAVRYRITGPIHML